MSSILSDSLLFWRPELCLAAGALLSLLLGAWGRPSRAAIAMAWLTVFATAFLLAAAPGPSSAALFFDMIVIDPFASVFRWLALATTSIVLLMVVGSRDGTEPDRGEYAGLVLMVGLGLMLMAQANNLLMAYVAVELVSLSSYLLVGFADDARGREAALKYLFFGALSSGVMLFGMSLLFGLTGELGFLGLLQAASGWPAQPPSIVLLSVLLILVGVAFKISLVPFHMWTPDVYEGAPVPVTALLSVGPKAAALALLVRMVVALQPVWPALGPVLIGLTVLTMTFGNLVALVQTNVKRLFAYSTIGQVGYLLIGLVVQTPAGLQGMILYLIAYLFMNLGAFACLAWVVQETGRESLDAFNGLGRRSPALAFLLALFLLSLAGIPPLFGFIGKFYLFGAAIQAHHVPLAVAGAVNSAIALYYYVKLIRQMYLATEDAPVTPRGTLPLKIAAGICAIATIGFGVFPTFILAWLPQVTQINLL